jgi:NTP pyrophosphatase (non-canonical NTP hydrolase)
METENGTPNNSLQIQGEANIASSSARVQAETQAAIMVAQRFRRSESQCRQDLLNAVKASPRLADKATYSYPRGKKQDPVTKQWVENMISGPSTYIAREAARVWGNLVYGTEVVRDTDTERQTRSFAWDMQTNMRCVAEASFKKLIQRSKWVDKNGGREKITEWVEPDERDLRELSNKYASIGERNCILKVIPSHLVDEVLEVARQTTGEEAAKHPEAVRAKLADAFEQLGITVAMLEEYLKHPLKDTTPDKISDLRGIYTSIREGNSVWDDYRAAALPAEDVVPEMPALRALAKQLRWNDAKLSSEIGRNMADIPKLIATMTAQAAPAANAAPSGVTTVAGAVTTVEVISPTSRKPRAVTAPAQEF